MEYAVELAKKLVGFKTVRSNLKEISDCVGYCKKELEESGLRCKVVENNSKQSLLCNLQNFETGFLLTGHLDVVEGKEEQFTPRVEEGKLFGRGAVDMKAGCAIAISVMKKLAKEGKEKNVGLVLTTDEEVGGIDGMGFLAGKLKAKFAVALEPGQGGITVKHKGVLWAKLVASGKSAHASRPWLGENAAEKLVAALPQALALANSPKKEEWIDTVSLGTMKAGFSTNKVPEEAEATLDYRVVDNESLKKIPERLKKIEGVSTQILEASPMLDTDEKNSFVQQLASCREKVFGEKTKFVYGHGASDMRWLSEKGIPAVVFGPAGGNYHGDGEFVLLEEINKVEKVYCEFAEFF